MPAILPPDQEVLYDSMIWMDAIYDPDAALLWHPNSPEYQKMDVPVSHMVRESTYYAIGLFMRGTPKDQKEAQRVLNAVLDYQLDEPGAVYHGTFLRYPEEVRPGDGAREWKDYDPNWRDFIGTGLALVLIHYENLLSPTLVQRIDRSFRLAVEGTLSRRVRPGYTNIALMDAYLLHFAGQRLGVEDWKMEGEQLGQKVYDLFQEFATFEEYNSPTYYGTDLYALRLWRSFSSSELLTRLGAEMESLLWEDIARFYHADLGNVAGPWDRSYGMDMRRYAALLGLWIWLATGRERAPFPNTQQPFEHCADLCFGPVATMTGAEIPESALPHFLAFQGPRQIEHGITSTPRRIATAWIDEQYMMGGEWTSRSKQGYAQFHPFTLHWKTAEGETGWARLRHGDPVDVRITRSEAVIEGSGRLVFEIFSPDTPIGNLIKEGWKLNGLNIEVQSSPAGFEILSKEGNLTELHYVSTGEIRLRLRVLSFL